MEFKSKFFHELTTTELYELLKARAAVFVVEQTCIYQDLDDLDYEALHIFYEKDSKILACLRAHPTDEEGIIKIGRVLTIDRGTGLGGKLLNEALIQVKEKMNPKEIFVHAQSYAAGYYKKAGFQITSDEFMEDDIPHVEMRLILK